MDPELGRVAAIIGFIFAIIWLFVPFAIFGIKPLLTSIRDELKKINAHNEVMLEVAGGRRDHVVIRQDTDHAL